MMVLFGGGDGGGFWIGPDGKIHRIPPYGPEVLFQLKVASRVLSAAGRVEKDLGREFLALGEKLTAQAVPQVVKIADAATVTGNVLFFDADDGFTCGSTGQRPIPIPHGPGPIRAM